MLIFAGGETLLGLGISSSGPIRNRARLRELELDALFGDFPCERLSFSELKSGGPDGRAGVLVSYATVGKVAAARWDPERQSWRQVSHAVWIAMDRDPKSGTELIPGPEDFDRLTVRMDCENVVMADGSIWEIPVIREPVSGTQFLPPELHGCRLPKTFYRGIDGIWQSEVTAEYRQLWETSCEMFESLLESEPIPYVKAFEFAVAVIGLRYRFNALMHSRCPEAWLNTSNVLNVIRAAIGWNVVERLLDDKKKAVLTES